MVNGHWSLRHWSLVIGHWLLVIGHWSLVIGHWSLVIGHYCPVDDIQFSCNKGEGIMLHRILSVFDLNSNVRFGHSPWRVADESGSHGLFPSDGVDPSSRVLQMCAA